MPDCALAMDALDFFRGTGHRTIEEIAEEEHLGSQSRTLRSLLSRESAVLARLSQLFCRARGPLA
jgi:hypothetical protein